MENEIYEKDYGEEFRERSDKSEGKDFLDTLMEVGFFQKYQEEMNKIPVSYTHLGGTVVEVGKNVKHLKVGDRVALEPGKTCGH